MSAPTFRKFKKTDTDEVIALWKICLGHKKAGISVRPFSRVIVSCGSDRVVLTNLRNGLAGAADRFAHWDNDILITGRPKNFR